MNQRIKVDIHGMTELEALKFLERTIASTSEQVKEICVIHGYHSGNSLKEMVRNRNKLRSKRIKRRKMTMNQGETILELY